MNGDQEDPRNWASANSRRTTIDQATGWVEIHERQSDEQDWMLVETFQVPEIVAVYRDRHSAANMLAESVLEIATLRARLASALGLVESAYREALGEFEEAEGFGDRERFWPESESRRAVEALKGQA